jgi:hypothetical protein
VPAAELPASRDFPNDQSPLTMEQHQDADSLTRSQLRMEAGLMRPQRRNVRCQNGSRLRPSPRSGFDPTETSVSD